MIHGSNIGTKTKDWKPTEANCEAIYDYATKAYQFGYNAGKSSVSSTSTGADCRYCCQTVEAELARCKRELEDADYTSRHRGFIEGQTR